MMRYHSKAHHHHHPVPHPTPVWLILMYLWGVPRGQSLYQATEAHSQDWVEFHYRMHHNFTMHTHEPHRDVVSAHSAHHVMTVICTLLEVSAIIFCLTVCRHCIILSVCTSHVYWLFKPPSIWCVVLPCLNTTCVTSHKSFCVQVCVYSACMFVLCAQSLSSWTL